jgi:predicted O-linked N-acetylglucosamine transferase (SPINDLY family)
MDMGRAREALEQFAVAMSLAPRNVVTHSTYLATLNYMGHLEPGAVFEAHRKFGERFEPTVRRLPPAARPAGDDATRRPLRVGYLSPDLRTHAVAHFIEPVLAHHDRAAVESFCYHDSPIVDAVSRRLQSLAAHWTHAFGMSDDALAQRIQQDGIDILVDLAGHMGNERLLLLARKPASVQATWIGYPNTTGLTSIDFRITDALADPPGMTESLHTEQLVRLPECFSCYQPPADTPPVASLPALRNGFVTFGSFNNIAKMTPQVVQVWARILQRVPQARLTLKTKVLRSPSMQTLVRGAFAAHGVAGERLTLLGNDASVREHFDRCNAIDVALDPFPYNGTTTTLDALWMGVPVVSLAGRSHVGRVGVSQLSNLGLSELIARDEDDYVEIAARLAGDLPRLAALRSGLRERLRASPLMDAPRFTRHLEAAYRSMWQMRRL